MKINIEIDTIQELLELSEHLSRMVFIPVVEEPAPTVEPEPKVRKTRAKPAAEPVSEPQPEPAAEAAPEPEAAPAAAPEPEVKPEPKAEEKPAKPAKPKKVTRDDVVAAFRGYIDRFGQKAAMTDVTVLLKRGFDVSMIKEIPDGEYNFKKAIAIVTDAINTNEFNREAVQ